MSLLSEYYDRDEKAPDDPAKKILFAVISELYGRGGFDDWWGNIGDDLQEEVLEDNLKIIRQNLP